jgi:RNA polymerase sigma-70 factor, ECF subfamily
MGTDRETNPLADLVIAAKAGDVAAFGALVAETQAMSRALALRVLGEATRAQDAVQDAYLCAHRALRHLEDPAAFPGWLRRVVITVALNIRRTRRLTLLSLDDVLEVPVLDEQEQSWSDVQRHHLAAALLRLSSDDRQICDRRYHGGWSPARLAKVAGVTEPTMRKRLQRIRDRLRQFMEMEEIEKMKQYGIDPEANVSELPSKIVELLASPRLTDIPENPVGSVLEQLRQAYPDFAEQPLPEIVNLASAGEIAKDALYVEASELHHLDSNKILRYDLTLPLLLTVRYQGRPIRLWASGKTYRACEADATHLEAFHQLECFELNDRQALDPWKATARVLQSVDRALPGRSVKIMSVQYPMCSRAWELQVDDNGDWVEVLAWGVFTDRIVTYLGGDPSRHIAIGVGYGLERFAMVRYGIDDIRKIDVARVA